MDVLALAPEDQIPHLCLHTLFHHQFELGLRICWEIRESIRHHGAAIDWGRVQRLASSIGILFPSARTLGDHYPASVGSRWFYLYDPRRWLDLLRQYGRTAFRLIPGDREVAALVQRARDRASLMDWLKAAAS